MSKIRILAFIVFIAGALISYLSTQPEAQIGPESIENEVIRGNIDYTGTGCSNHPEDRVDLFDADSVFLFSTDVYFFGGWRYKFTSQQVTETGWYIVVPYIKLAISTGVIPKSTHVFVTCTEYGCNPVSADFTVRYCIQQ